MLFNNYKASNNLRPVELGTPTYLDTIGANLLDAPNDLAQFLTSYIPTDSNVKEQNVFQTLHNSIELIKENPNQSTTQKIVGIVSWLAGMAPGFGIASKAVKASTGLLGIATRTPLTKSIEGGIAYGVADYPIQSIEHPERTNIGKLGKLAEDVALGGITEYGVRAALPALRAWLKSPKSNNKPIIEEGAQQSVEENVPRETFIDELNEHGLNPTQSSKDSLNYSVLHEAVRHTELSHPNTLGEVLNERILSELQSSPQLNNVIESSVGKDKFFYQAIKDYKPNTDTDKLIDQLNQMGTQNFNKPEVMVNSRDEFIKQFHSDNLDISIPEHATLKKHIENTDALDAFIKCMTGL